MDHTVFHKWIINTRKMLTADLQQLHYLWQTPWGKTERPTEVKTLMYDLCHLHLRPNHMWRHPRERIVFLVFVVTNTIRSLDWLIINSSEHKKHYSFPLLTNHKLSREKERERERKMVVNKPVYWMICRDMPWLKLWKSTNSWVRDPVYLLSPHGVFLLERIESPSYSSKRSKQSRMTRMRSSTRR